jgi:hypothetical protein
MPTILHLIPVFAKNNLDKQAAKNLLEFQAIYMLRIHVLVHVLLLNPIM